MTTFKMTKLEVTIDINSSTSNKLDRLDRSLAEHISTLTDAPKLSRTRLKNLIQSGCISLNGKTILDPSSPVKLGQTYNIEIPEPTSATPEAQSIKLDIIYEDDYLIVINKAARMVVHPAPGSWDGTLVNALLAHCGNTLSGIGGVKRPGIVHRLDKDTTGLMVVAKSDEAHHHLVHQFAARTIRRSYEALIWGAPENTKGRIELPIGRSRRNRKKMAVTVNGGKPAATNYKILENFNNTASLIECQLESGRTHQIRVHFSHIGHSIIGDPLYGGSDNRTNNIGPDIELIKNFGRQALHATSLEFIHPQRRELVCFSAPQPIEMQHLIGAFRKINFS
jgi:23S rRNA pseudouridine1911/1915/1917 synthase